MALPTAASVVTGGLASYPTIVYDKIAVDTLRSNLYLYPACELRQMPNNSGVAIQIYGNTAFGANTTPATEGTPGSGQALSQVVRTINLSQYVDYLSYSDKAVLTGFSELVSQGSQELAYRGALSVDTVISTQLDTIATATTSISIDVTNGSRMSAALSRQAAMSLRSVNVKTKPNGKFFGVIGALQAFDLINDASAGGFIDLMKFTSANAPKLQEGIDANNFVGEVGGVEWYESNSLPYDTDWESSGTNAYHAYVIGLGGIFASSLGKTELGQRNFSVKTTMFDQPMALDPANQIRATSAYNFFFGCVGRPGSVPGFRRIRSESSIG
jgi:N4-gp56 family major capsid protein